MNIVRGIFFEEMFECSRESDTRRISLVEKGEIEKAWFRI